MSIASEITRLQNAKAALKSSIEAKGVTVDPSATLDSYSELVDSIPTGGGEELIVGYTASEVSSEQLVISKLNDLVKEAIMHSSSIIYGGTQASDVVTPNIKKITIPDSITSLPDRLAQNCTKLEEVIFGRGISSTGQYTFMFCTRLTNVALPDNIKSIGPSSFYSTGLTSINLNKVTTINSLGFGHSKLTSIDIPSTVSTIAAGAFSYCNDLVSIAVDPDNLVYDSRNNCNAIIETDTNKLVVGCNATIIDSTVTIIGDSAFMGAKLGDSFEVPQNITTIESGAFYGITSKHIILNEGLLTIGSNAFSGCKELLDINIPRGVTSIGNGAFSSSSKITSIELPDSVQSIGDYCFNSCSLLESVTLHSIVPPTLGETPFSWTSSNLKIYVPSDSVDTYKNASGWYNYSSKIYAIPES